MAKEYDFENLKRPRHKQSTMGSSLSWVGAIWSFLSFVAMGLSCVGYYMPFWLEGRIMNTTQTYLGVFRRCNYPALDENGRIVVVKECGRYTHFTDIPSLWWQIATISIGVGCGLTILIAFTALLSCCLEDVLSRTSAKVAGVFQFLAGVGIGAGCLLYPLGWESHEVRQACGPDVRLFALGQCTISWAYYTTMAGAGACFLSSLLSCSASKQKRNPYRS